MSEADGRFVLNEDYNIPVLDEDTNWTHADWDYVLHTNWAARVLARTRPQRHVDIGSYSYFATLCSTFVPNFEFYDVRPLGVEVPGLKMDFANLFGLPFSDNSVPSLSCLHVIEHIGLARYGDRLDAKGDIRAAQELIRVLAPGGRLLIVVPMNLTPRVNFNAHRIYAPPYVADLFKPLALDWMTVLSSGRITSTDGEIPQGDFTGCFELTKL